MPDTSNQVYVRLLNDDNQTHPAFSNAAAGLTSSDLTPSPTPAGQPNGLHVVINATTGAGEADVRDFDFGGDGINDNWMQFILTADAPGTQHR